MLQHLAETSHGKCYCMQAIQHASPAAHFNEDFKETS
jgi:hypothetical protein